MKRHGGVPTYYFPTTVIFVDDSNDFLMNFSLQFDPKLSYRLYDSPLDALRYINDEDELPELNQRCFSEYADGTRCPITNHTINVDIGTIHREIYNPRRFSVASVIIVDFAMPSMNGLEFCERLKDHPSKKILLTGQAGEKTAVQAFNDGIIDRFILKSHPNVIHTINEAIHELQLGYFHDTAEMIVNALSVNAPNFLKDPTFSDFFFNEICKSHNIVEYYLTETTGSFLLLNADAEPHWLIIKRKTDLQIYKEFAVDNNAPQSIIAALDTGEKIPYFWHANDYFQTSWPMWENSLHPAKKFGGDEIYYYAIIKDLNTSGFNREEILSYNNYLETQDIVA
jgi:CheY-like chemotaxis protein